MNSTTETFNEHKDHFKTDIHRDPRELEREADRARAELEHTLEALERRFSPGELLDQGLRMFKSGGSGFGRNLADQVRNNPVPTVLTGIGLTWLMAASDRPPPAYRGRSGSSLTEKASGAASAGSGAADKARGLAGQARGAASQARGAASHAADSTRAAAERGRAAAENAAHYTQEMSRSVADATRSGARSAWQGYDYLRREQPLVLGALAVAAGAIIGGLLPRSQVEDQYIGEYSDETRDRLKEEARHQMDQAKETAADTAEKVSREAKGPSSSSGGSASSSPDSTQGQETPVGRPPGSPGTGSSGVV